MRKALFILALAVLSLVSCNKEIPNDQEVNEVTVTNIVFNLTANHPDGTTKAVKTGWESGDVIFVFFNNIAAPRYLKMSYDGSDWNYTQMNGVSEESLGLVENATGTMRAVFLPFASDADISADGTSFIFSETPYSYYLTATLDYTVTDGEVSGAFNMQIPSGYIQFFLDDASASSSTEIELREPHLTPQGVASITADGTITHTSIASGAPLPGYVYDKENKTGSDVLGYLFSGVLSAEAQNISTDYLFTLVRGGWEGSYYKKEFSGKTWYRGESEGRALKMPAISNWTPIVNYKPIDLGTDYYGSWPRNYLRRIYWSSCNLGASAPEGYGDYYAWGEIEPYYIDGHAQDEYCTDWKDGKSTGYDWTSYRWANGNYNKLTKYCPKAKTTYWDGEGTPDGKSVLDLADDAAYQILGGYWHIPEYYEWRALTDNCTHEWITVNGVNGTKVTSTINGNSIFLPASGDRVYTSISLVGSRGIYWTSSIYSSNPHNAQVLRTFSDGRFQLFYETRIPGFLIRPICE